MPEQLVLRLVVCRVKVLMQPALNVPDIQNRNEVALNSAHQGSLAPLDCQGQAEFGMIADISCIISSYVSIPGNLDQHLSDKVAVTQERGQGRGAEVTPTL